MSLASAAEAILGGCGPDCQPPACECAQTDVTDPAIGPAVGQNAPETNAPAASSSSLGTVGKVLLGVAVAGGAWLLYRAVH